MTLRDAAREFREVPLGLIDPPKLRSRAEMDEGKLDELTRSIQQLGVLNPITLGRVGDRYEVIAGDRRYTASKRAGLVAVPAIVYPSVDAAHEAAKYAENRFREDLNPAEEAIWFSELLDRDCGGDVDRLCEQLGEKRAYVEGRLNLFAGDPEIFGELQAGRISLGVAQELNKCTDPATRRSLLVSAVQGGATKTVVTAWLMDWKRSQTYAAAAAAPAPAPESHLSPIAKNPFICYACKEGDHVYTMQSVFFHGHCLLTTVEKALDLYAHRVNYLARPRTVDEARALVAALVNDWPDLVPSTD